MIVWQLVIFRLYDKLKEYDNAAAAFTEYCLREEDNKARFNDDQTEFYAAFQYLANYHLKKGQLDEAYSYAYKCMENDQVFDYKECNQKNNTFFLD